MESFVVGVGSYTMPFLAEAPLYSVGSIVPLSCTSVNAERVSRAVSVSELVKSGQVRAAVGREIERRNARGAQKENDDRK